MGESPEWEWEWESVLVSKVATLLGLPTVFALISLVERLANRL